MKNCIHSSSTFYIFLLGSLFFSTLVYSPQALSEVRPTINFCEPEIFNNLKEASSLGQWQVIPPAHPNSEVFRTPSKVIGKWIELKITKDAIDLVHFTDKGMNSWTFKKQNCKPTSAKEDRVFITLDSKGFTDDDLVKVFPSKKTTMIYIWDPAAFHSVDKYLVFKTEAIKRKYDIISLLAPHADENWAAAEIKKKSLDLNTRRLSSLELIMRGGNLHYPSVFFIQDGKISKRLVGGLEKANVSRFFDTFTKNN